MKRRILHVVSAMNRGGTETWLMNILRRINQDKYRLDFLVDTANPAEYDQEIRRLGSNLIHIDGSSIRPRYAREFRRIMMEHGPFDIIHSHLQYYSGFVLWLASRAGVPVRIAHTHLDTTRLDAAASPSRRTYNWLMRYWIKRYATGGLAASRPAAAALFGPKWKADARWQILHCGVDPEPFKAHVDARVVRRELGVPDAAIAIGHVGRFELQKNHTFLVEIASAFAELGRDFRMLLVGTGRLMPEIRNMVMDLRVSDKVIFLGSRPDVPRLMLGAMDVFAFPSRYEGLGLVLLEAQAAGLNCVVSDIVPKEADVFEPLMHRLSLGEPAAVWAKALLDTAESPERRNPDPALEAVLRSSFHIEASLAGLTDYYDRALAAIEPR